MKKLSISKYLNSKEMKIKTMRMMENQAKVKILLREQVVVWTILIILKTLPLLILAKVMEKLTGKISKVVKNLLDKIVNKVAKKKMEKLKIILI